MTYKRRLPIGAELMPGGGAHLRVWAPAAERVWAQLLDDANGVVAEEPLSAEAAGYFSGTLTQARAGSRYRFRLPRGSFPDPASRHQPEGPHGPSSIVDPTYAWNDQSWTGRAPEELVIYELHLGTFTREGTWRAAMKELPELARLGITCIEVMPIAEFPGRFGWGYDGVDLYAPTRLYGPPDDARAFVNSAHELGVMVILDVVYNHLGPDGCFLREFSPDYFTTKYKCEWGDPLNFDGDNSGPVREYFINNARYWVDEFHFDGLRLDATQQVYDSSPVHVLADITSAVRAAAPGRRTFVVAENEPQETRLLKARARGGFGMDAIWNDDFHHNATVAATGRVDAYYVDYQGTPQEFVSAAKYGFLFQGQCSRWQKKRRGTPSLNLPPNRFVAFIENHDQVSNALQGLRTHRIASPGTLRAITTVLLLSPSIPLLFQGQEFASSRPFVYFADHNPELAQLVAKGRRSFLEQFRAISAADARDMLPDPGAEKTFTQCKLDLEDRDRNRSIYQLHEDLLRLRREDPVFRAPVRIDGAVLGPDAFVLRFFGSESSDRILVVNLGTTLHMHPSPEPLLAPLEDHGWSILWSSEAPRYGGGGSPAAETLDGWLVPGRAALVLKPDANRELPRAKLSEKD